MKHTIKLSLFFALVILGMISCGNKKTEETAAPAVVEETKMPEKATIDVTADTISNAKFNDWTTRWQNNQRTWITTHSINYFGMPLVDLREVLNTQGAVSSRFYIGLTPQDSIHLVVVGVNAQGQNMLDNSKGEYAYDVSKPCPPYCGSGGGEAKK